MKIFLLMLISSAGPCLLMGIYELIRFHKVIYGKGNPLMMAIGCSILLSVIMAGFITQDIVSPIRTLLLAIREYTTKKVNPRISFAQRNDEFGYLFEEYEKMIADISSYQYKITQSARLAAIGQSTAMVAHDVRKPLASMKALLTSLPSIQDDPEQVKRMITAVDRNISQTNMMLNDILEFSKDSTSLNIEDASPQSVITSALADALRNHEGSSVTIDYNLTHKRSLRVDAPRISRVLTNLIDNALDAMTPRGGTAAGSLEVDTVECLNDGKKTLIIKVTDSGPGIPEDLLPKIFDPFFSHGKQGGSGLGLAISQRIISLHGGTIRAKNRKGKSGAEFM
ncbi:MAG: HAMP domain-containing sensor histidine kinase, partial [Pseudomonadota bacterium]